MPPQGSKRAASEAPGPKVKWNKHDRGSLPNHYTVDNWKGFILKKILEAVLAVKVRGLTLANMKAFQTTVIPQYLYSRIKDLLNWISYANGLLKSKHIESHWPMAQRLLEQYPDDKRREVAQKAANNRKQYLSMHEVAPFQGNDDVYEFLHLDTKDIFFLWAPIQRDVTPEYLSMHDRATDGGFHCCAHEDLPWPPMRTIDCWSEIPLEAGVVEEVWPRPGEAANSPQDSPGVPMTVPGITDYSISEHQESGVQGISMKAIEEMEKACTTQDMETVNLVKRLLGTMELTPVVGNDGVVELRPQYSVEYISAESSRLAQMNTSGHVRYALKSLEIDKKSYQVLEAALQTREKELEAESVLLKSKEEEAKVWKDEVKAIEECVALRRKANAELKQLLARDQEENQSCFNRVHPGVVDALRPGSMFGFDASPVRRPAQALCGRRSFPGINDSPRLGYPSFGASCDAARLGVGYTQGPGTGPIQNDGAEEETGATNRERLSMPGLVSDALGMLGGGGGVTSFGSGNEHEIELIDGSCGPTSVRWDEDGGEGKDMVSEYLSSQSSATQTVIPAADLSFG
ncbi:hypothetical protein K440DRAFT_642604 [Wilcoxina mikolae CBS 423.85]|nr:hypothetical protein K440DRAFT_642604 [Wilcoxina mikolae CBS 423.85]